MKLRPAAAAAGPSRPFTAAARSEPAQPEELNLGALRIDCQACIAWRDGRPIHLTAKDFELSICFSAMSDGFSRVWSFGKRGVTERRLGNA